VYGYEMLKKFYLLVIVLCMNHPPAVMSRHRSASMSRPVQKRRKITSSGNDKSGLTCINIENRA
jgi:hypothetical protein